MRQPKKLERIIAGVIASKSKDLTLDTGTIGYRDLVDVDKRKDYGGSLSLNGPLSGGGNKSQEKAGNPNELGFSVDGSYSSKKKEGISRATVGEGVSSDCPSDAHCASGLTIRDKVKQKELENTGKTQKLTNLNRDLDKAQQVTKDEVTEINLYVSDTSLKTTLKVAELAGKTFIQAVNEVTADQVKTGEISGEEKKEIDELAEKIRKGEITRDDLVVCLDSASVSPSLLNWIIKPAYAAGSCPGIGNKEKLQNYLDKLLKTGSIVLALKGKNLAHRAGVAVGMSQAFGGDVKATSELGWNLIRLASYSKNSQGYKEASAYFDQMQQGLNYVINNPKEFGIQITDQTKGQLELYAQLLNEGKYYEAGKVQGKILYHFSAVITGAGAVAKLATKAPKLASLLPNLKRGEIYNTIRSPLPEGLPGAIYRGFGDLNQRQRNLLTQLQNSGDILIIPKKGISQKDLAALTAKTGDEFAVFTTGGRRMIVRGGANSFDGIIDTKWAKEKAAQGWRFSAHTHPVPEGIDPKVVLRSSGGDQAILKLFPNKNSAILNSEGGRRLFTHQGDSLQGWLPE